MELFISIGKRLREVREGMELSQSEFAGIAARAGVPGATRQSQARYEKGEQMPGAAYLAAIADAGADVFYVLTGQRITAGEQEFQRRLDVVAHVSRQATAAYLRPDQADLLQRIGMAAETGDSTTLRQLLRPLSERAAALLDDYERVNEEDRRAIERHAASLAGPKSPPGAKKREPKSGGAVEPVRAGSDVGKRKPAGRGSGKP